MGLVCATKPVMPVAWQTELPKSFRGLSTFMLNIEAFNATHRRAQPALDALFASLQQRAFAGAL